MTRGNRATLATAALLLAWDITAGDLWLSRQLGDARGFIWQEHWFTQGLLHDGARRVGLLLIVLLVLNLRWPLWPGLSFGERLRWLLTTLACLGAVTLLKHSSATSCPWDLNIFGGVAGHLSHWRWRTSDGGPGGCFPSGHAATAFAFFSGWFAWRERRPAMARRWLAGTLIVGTLLGAAQVMRGAHFASHIGWTAWVCWVLSALLWRLAPARRLALPREVTAPAPLRPSPLPPASR